MQRRVSSILSVFLVFVVYDYLYWVVFFADVLEAGPMAPGGWLWYHGASLVMAVCFALLFERGWVGSGVAGGAKFGLLVGLLWGIGAFMSYAQGTGTLAQTLGDMLGDTLMFVVAGAALGWMEGATGRSPVRDRTQGTGAVEH
jgi:hypothetical protein